MLFEGGCLCGNTTYIAKGEPYNPHLCSCTMCQIISTVTKEKLLIGGRLQLCHLRGGINDKQYS